MFDTAVVNRQYVIFYTQRSIESLGESMAFDELAVRLDADCLRDLVGASGFD
jgi:hypothetical protein